VNAHTPPVDPRAVFLRRAARVGALHRGGRLNADQAFNALIHPFLEIVGPAARLCKICGDPPWRHDEAWCRACAEGEARRRADRTEPPTPARAAASTLEALMYSLRERGIKALGEPDTLRRLCELSDEQLRDVAVRLQQFQPHIAPAWKAEDIRVLITVRSKARANS
jgi:hypothetical protein